MIAGLELLACVRRELTDLVGCAELHQQALTALDMASPGADRDQLRLAALVRLGEALRLLGKFTEAEDAQKRAVQLAEGNHRPTPPPHRATVSASRQARRLTLSHFCVSFHNP
jgi:hypothetical protein